MIKISIWVGIIGLIIACFIGLHAFMDSANKQEVENLKSIISMLQLQKEETNSKLASAQNMAEKCNLTEISEDPGESEISERLSLVEKERNFLLQKSLSQTLYSIDPRSEIASHITLLQSENEEEQASAVNFLFKIRDPVTFKPLQDYFIQFNASRNMAFAIHTMYSWYELFIELNMVAGVEFVVNELSSPNSFNSKIAFETLGKAVENITLAQEAKPKLETLALISDNASARGYAKILLEKISNMDHETQ